MHSEHAVVLLAGGSGSRLAGDQAKQFIRLAGKPVLIHSYDALRRHLPDAPIAVVVPGDAIEAVRKMLPAGGQVVIVSGGATRQASTLNGLKALASYAPRHVIIHDAARPFVSGRIIADVVDALKASDAIDVAIPTSDTIVVERDGYIEAIPKRQHILRGQTPQAFRFDALMDCYQRIGEERLHQFTDDCGIYLHCNPNAKVRIVLGDEENIKITHPIDLILADEMFRIRTSSSSIDRPGIDVRGKRILIFGGTAGIGKALADILIAAGAEVQSRSRSNGCDITVEEQVRNAVNDSVKSLGGLDVVINCVGMLNKNLLTQQSSDEISNQIDVNFSGAVWIAKWSHEPLKRSKGMLLQFASSSYTRGRADHVIYAATKAAIVNMTQGLSEEWAADGIRVNCVIPGRTDTEMRRKNFHGESQDTLYNPYQVALGAAKALCTSMNGQLERV
jgi:2-C-methyl-D-erythritol 4-phosphate cytidylyltransferase